MDDRELKTYQFRLPLLFCLTALVAVGLAGARISLAAPNSAGAAKFVERAFELAWIAAPTAAVLVLCLRRKVVVFPVAAALFLSTVLSCHGGLAPAAAIVLIAIGLLTGSVLGLVRVLSQRITAWRLVLSTVCCLYLGIFGQYIVAVSLYSGQLAYCPPPQNQRLSSPHTSTRVSGVLAER
jgi:hypothetical protein